MIKFADIVLTQEQLNAITPVVNENMQKPMKLGIFKEKCLQAMIDAGCPLK